MSVTDTNKLMIYLCFFLHKMPFLFHSSLYESLTNLLYFYKAISIYSCLWHTLSSQRYVCGSYIQCHSYFIHMQKDNDNKSMAWSSLTSSWGQSYKTFYARNLQSQVLHSRVGSWPTNIRLGWKGLPETNILAYCENS